MQDYCSKQELTLVRTGHDENIIFKDRRRTKWEQKKIFKEEFMQSTTIYQGEETLPFQVGYEVSFRAFQIRLSSAQKISCIITNERL